MIYGLSIFVLVLATDLFTDVRLYYRKRKVNHSRGAVLRIVGLVPAVYFLGWIAIPAMGFIYLILFNGLYNVLIGQKWGFIGTTAKLDKWQRRNKWFSWFKYAAAIGFTILYLIVKL